MTVNKLGVAVVANAAGLLSLWVLLRVWPAKYLKGIEPRDWVELFVLLAAVGGAAAVTGSRLGLRHSGIAGVIGVFLFIGALRAPLFDMPPWFGPASIAIAMLLIARPTSPART